MAANSDAAETAPVAEAPAPKDWAPATVTQDGVHLHGEFPVNHRLRAEAIVKKGRKTDPDGLITEDFIAETAKRLKGKGGKG